MAFCEVLPVTDPSPLTAREQAVIQDADFFESYKDEVRELFAAVGREDRWSDDPEAVCTYMENAWLGGEHGNSAEKEQFTPDQERAGWEVIAAAGFTRRISPEAGLKVDAAAQIGATDPTNQVTSLEFRYLRERRGLQTPSLRLWAGELRGRTAADGSVEEIIARLRENGHAPDPGSAWLQRHIEREGFATELDLARLCLGILVDGGHELNPARVDVSLTDVNDPHAKLPEKLEYTDQGEVKRLPARAIMDRHFVAADGLRVTLMNGAAVPRDRGRPRHTSRSCAQEHLERYPLPQGGRLLLVGAQPYGVRIAQEIRDVLDGAGRADVTLDVAFAPLRPDMPIQSALGNFASLTRLDIRRNHTRKG